MSESRDDRRAAGPAPLPGPARGRSLWAGVLVASTTPFRADGTVDRTAFVRHGRWLAERGVDGIIVAGSLGEGSSLTPDERASLVADLVAGVPEGFPVVAAIAAARTSDAVAQAQRAAASGAEGLLVLPPYVYRGDRAEIGAHFAAVLGATELPCMLYNNPAAYGTDVGPEEVLELASAHPTLSAVKESTDDVRRITALRSLLGNRVEVAVGLDEAILGGVRAGAVGWVAGLANALPDESVALFEADRRGDSVRASALFDWFLPLLRMDTGPKFVQRIKLVEEALGVGLARVRAPRLELRGEERAATLATIRERLDRRPVLSAASPPDG